jgi:hypothetical protein
MRLLLRAFGKALLAILAIVAVFALMMLIWFGLNWLLDISIWLVLGLAGLIIVGTLTASYYDEIKYNNSK